MTIRRPLTTAIACAVLAATTPGCMIDRAGIGGAGGIDARGADDAGRDDVGPRDVGTTDTGGLDGGPSCTASSCDDGNLCTDDACGPSGCTHVPNSAGCDDGVLCNGGDTCSDGACTVHDRVDPCSAPAICDPVADACVGCVSSTDCPARMEGPFGSCTFAPGDVCLEAGSRGRSVTTYACESARCVPSTTTESERCMRDTGGVSCGATETSDYGACVYGHPTCSTSGTRTRSVTTYACVGGTCASETLLEMDSAGCARVTEGVACGSATPGPWSTCAGFTDLCDQSGTRSRTVTGQICTGGACQDASATETEACARMTDGLSCGTGTCGTYGACMRVDPTTCDPMGTQSRTCVTPTCGSGVCENVPRSEAQDCMVGSISGLPCMPDSMMCSPCTEAGRTDCRRGRSGFQLCPDGPGVCSVTLSTCIDTTPATVACACP